MRLDRPPRPLLALLRPLRRAAYVRRLSRHPGAGAGRVGAGVVRRLPGRHRDGDSGAAGQGGERVNIALYRAQADPRRLARVGAYGPYWSFLVRLMGLVA